jgi:hypothetical protein
MVDEVRVPDMPTAALQERVAPEDTTRAVSPEIQEAEEAGAALLQGAASGEAQALELPRGRPLPSPATTPRTTRKLRRRTPWSADLIVRITHSTS